jgi:hypothetical protein
MPSIASKLITIARTLALEGKVEAAEHAALAAQNLIEDEDIPEHCKAILNVIGMALDFLEHATDRRIALGELLGALESLLACKQANRTDG